MEAVDLTPTGKPANPGYDKNGNPLGPGWPESSPGVQYHPTRGKVISCEKDIAGDQLRKRNAGATKSLSAAQPDATIASLERPSPFGCGTFCGELSLFFNVRRAPRFCTPITNARAPTQLAPPECMNAVWFPSLWLQDGDISSMPGIGPQEAGALTMTAVLTMDVSSVAGCFGTRCLPFSSPHRFPATFATHQRKNTYTNHLISEA